MVKRYIVQYTVMDFLVDRHSVIVTRKEINIDRGDNRGQYFFWSISHHVYPLKCP